MKIISSYNYSKPRVNFTASTNRGCNSYESTDSIEKKQAKKMNNLMFYSLLGICALGGGLWGLLDSKESTEPKIEEVANDAGKTIYENAGKNYLADKEEYIKEQTRIAAGGDGSTVAGEMNREIFDQYASESSMFNSIFNMPKTMKTTTGFVDGKEHKLQINPEHIVISSDGNKTTYEFKLDDISSNNITLKDTYNNEYKLSFNPKFIKDMDNFKDGQNFAIIKNADDEVMLKLKKQGNEIIATDKNKNETVISMPKEEKKNPVKSVIWGAFMGLVIGNVLYQMAKQNSKKG